MGASRFPGKVLAPLRGRPVLEWVVRRVLRARLVDEVVVATSTASADHIIEVWARDLGVKCFRGDEADVLERFHAAAVDAGADWIVRINADNPFIDPQYIDTLLEASPGVDYIGYETAARRHTMLTGIGLFVEALSSDCLARAATDIQDPWLREHVTLGIYTEPDRYALRMLTVPSWCDLSWLRLTLDTPEDLDLFDAMTAVLGDTALSATGRDIVGIAHASPAWQATMLEIAERNTKTTGRPNQ